MTLWIDLKRNSRPPTLFSIERMKRSPIAGEAGSSEWTLDNLASAFAEEYDLRRSWKAMRRASPDGRDPLTWLKNACYPVIIAWMAAELWDEIEGRVVAEGRFTRGARKAQPNVFELGIMGVFAKRREIFRVSTSKPGGARDQSRDRSRIANAMWYAFRHYIPPELLDGFNMQYPGHRKDGGSAPNMLIEPPLREWVIEHRAHDELLESLTEQYRGRYPRRVEAAVKELVASHWAAHDDWQRRAARPNVKLHQSEDRGDDENW